MFEAWDKPVEGRAVRCASDGREVVIVDAGFTVR